MIGIYAFFWKGIKEFFSSKSAVFWTFLFPIIFGLLFAAVFGQESTPSQIPIGIVKEKTNSTLSQIFVENMANITVENKKLFNIYNYNDENIALKSLKKGYVKAVISFDSNFTENGTSPGLANMNVIFDKRDAQEYQLVSSAVGQYILQFENRMREIRINITMYYFEKYGNISEENKTHVERWLQGIANPINITEETYSGESNTRETRLWYETAAIGITFMFSGMIASASSISSEIEKGTARRLAITKTRGFEMLVGNLIYVLAVELISAFLIILSFFAVFGDLFYPDPLAWGMIIMAALSTISIGLLISSFTKTERAASGAANAIAWPISFITGIFLPEFLLPNWMITVGDYFPASALLRGVRKIVIYHQSIESYIPQILMAIISTIVILLIASIAFKWRMKKE